MSQVRVNNKINNEEVRTQFLTILEKAQQPVSTGYVAYHLNVSWSCAKEILLSLALEGKIAFLKTSKGFLFAASQSSIKLRFGVNLDNKPAET